MKSETIAYLCTGAILGGLAGVFLAPRSGSATRARVRAKANDAADYMGARAGDARKAASDLMDRGKGAIKQYSEKMDEIVDAGKQAYDQALQS